MKFHGIIHSFPKDIKILIASFLLVLSVGYYTGLLFVNDTTEMNSEGIEMQYLGNEFDEDAKVMKFKKSEREILTLVHNHILSLSIIFFLLSALLATTSINRKVKRFLMIEPFISILLTFGGIYIIWLGITWFKYVVMISGMMMTLSFISASVLVFIQLFKKQ